MKYLRWMIEAVVMIGVTATTGCPHCAAASLLGISGVEAYCGVKS